MKNKKKKQLILLSSLILTIILVFSCIIYLFSFQQLSLYPEESIEIQGLLFDGRLTWIGWLDEMGNNRKGYCTPPNNFYEGEQIKGAEWSFTLTQTRGHPCERWKMELTLEWQNSHQQIGFYTEQGGAISQGQTVDVSVRLHNGVHLETDENIRYEYEFSLYTSASGWEGMCSGTGTICVSQNLPNLKLNYFTLSKTIVEEGDSVTASMSVTNDGRASGTMWFAIWTNVYNLSFYTGDDVLLEKEGIVLGPGYTHMDSTIFTVTKEQVSSDNILRISIVCSTHGSEIMRTREITYIPSNAEPLQPSVIGETSLFTGQLGTWTAMSTDEEGDQIRYTWTIDGFPVRTSEYGESGLSDSYSQAFSAAGQHTVSVKAEDSNHAFSLSTVRYIQVIGNESEQQPPGEEQTYTMEISIMDSKTFDAVDGASVLCNNELKETGNLGIVSFSVPAGEHIISVSKQGYKTAIKTIMVSSDEMVITILLEPSEQNIATPPEQEQPGIPGFEFCVFVIAIAFYTAIRRKNLKSDKK